MSEELFRKKSIDSHRSPENLNDYVRVSNPGVWILLISIIVLLVGVCVWGFFGRIDSTIDVDVRVENGTVTCLIPEGNIAKVTVGMTVRFSGCEGKLTAIGNKLESWYLCSVSVDNVPADGTYSGALVLKSVKPSSLIFN